MKKIGRNRNTNDTAEISDGIPINQNTSTVIAPANPERSFIHINNDGENKESWIKLQAASIDNDMKGIFLKGRSDWQMPMDNIYTGEISAIGAVGTSTLYITEY